MKPQDHQFEDRLLEFAYGELAGHEAGAVEAHVQGCERCRLALSQIEAVRSAMQQLPREAPGPAGLDSLLAYAEAQAVRNARSHPRPWWRRAWAGRWATPLASLAALSLVAVVAWRAQDTFHPQAQVVALKVAAPAEAVEGSRPSATEPPAPAQLDEGGTARQANVQNVPALAKVEAPPRRRAAKDMLGGPAAAGAVAHDGIADRSASELGALSPGAGGNPRSMRGESRLREAEPAAAAPSPASSLEWAAESKQSRSAPTDELAVASAERDARPQAAQRAALVQATIQAGRASDRRAELRLSLQALQAGVVGSERAEMLRRGCDAAEALGEARQADQLCDRLVVEFPESPAARALGARRGLVQGGLPAAPAAAPAKDAAPAGKKAKGLPVK
jgi:hypothetical protein